MIVPTVERGLRPALFWSIAAAGARPLNVFDQRPFQLPQELPRVRGERFDVAPLALFENRIERKRRLARTAYPGKYRKGFVQYF